ncbi:MAG: MGMT family protein [Candidatus Levyibacteriota bacterium]
MKIFEKIYAIVSLVPKGKVLTYKKISDILNLRNPRIVGYALHANKNPQKIPCHRVVKSDGTLACGYAFGGIKKQKEKLIKEGVSFLNNNTVDLNKSMRIV